MFIIAQQPHRKEALLSKLTELTWICSTRIFIYTYLGFFIASVSWTIDERPINSDDITVYHPRLGSSFCCCCANRTSVEYWISKQLVCRWFSEQHLDACWWFRKVPHSAGCTHYTQCLCSNDVHLQYKLHGYCRMVLPHSTLGIYINFRGYVSLKSLAAIFCLY